MREIELNKQLPVITMNFDEVKASVIENMEIYKGIIVTEESLKDCKSTQKELASLRNKVDGYRKDVKREMEKPIKEFEGQCKELIGLIEEVERPIKSGITEFDNKRRDEKKKFADINIFKISQDLGLEKKYAEQLTVLDKYLNLTASGKSVVEDITQRAESLKQQQNMEKAKLELLKGSIETTLEAVNTKIKTPLKYTDFEKYIEMGWDAARIIREINDRARMIREAEKPKEETKEPVQIPVDIKAPEVPQRPKNDEQLYFVDTYVEGSFEQIQALSKFLQTNGYKYEVHSKGRVKNE